MNFAKLLDDLKGIGLSQAEIAKGIERAQSTVSEMKQTGCARITYETAERLKKFHADQMKARSAA